MPKKKTFHCYRYKITLNIFFIFLSLLVSSCWPYLLCRLRVIRRYFCNSNKQQQESRLWLYNFIRWMAFCDMNWAPFEFLNIFCLFFLSSHTSHMWSCWIIDCHTRVSFWILFLLLLLPFWPHWSCWWFPLPTSPLVLSPSQIPTFAQRSTQLSNWWSHKNEKCTDVNRSKSILKFSSLARSSLLCWKESKIFTQNVITYASLAHLWWRREVCTRIVW